MPTVHSDLWKWAVHLCILKIGASHVWLTCPAPGRLLSWHILATKAAGLYMFMLAPVPTLTNQDITHITYLLHNKSPFGSTLETMKIVTHTNGANNTRRATKAKADCILNIPRRVWRLKSNLWQAYRHKLPSQLFTINFLLRWIIETCHFC
ncbi:hypothetical protein NC651_031700 [Populus alba x Populus x berolinensis]|nr:hypothetical protein NC651_031700 [Populus alba x Populus x berolinensis]